MINPGLPPPGLRGNYERSCCVCLRGTDTALAFKGEGEWLIAGIHSLGVPMDDAIPMVSNALGAPPGEVPDGMVEIGVRVCSACAAKAPAWFPAPVVLMRGAPIPTIVQP